MFSVNVRYFALLSCSFRALAELLPRSFRALCMFSFAFEMLFSWSFLATQYSIFLLFFRDVRVFFLLSYALFVLNILLVLIVILSACNVRALFVFFSKWSKSK